VRHVLYPTRYSDEFRFCLHGAELTENLFFLLFGEEWRGRVKALPEMDDRAINVEQSGEKNCAHDK